MPGPLSDELDFVRGCLRSGYGSISRQAGHDLFPEKLLDLLSHLGLPLGPFPNQFSRPTPARDCGLATLRTTKLPLSFLGTSTDLRGDVNFDGVIKNRIGDISRVPESIFQGDPEFVREPE